MLETAIAQLRFAASLLFGRPLHQRSMDNLVAALLATRHEFGTIGADAGDLLSGPTMAPEELREMQVRRFRAQARRGMKQTRYYADLFARLDVDPAQLTTDDISRLPLLDKETLRAQPENFVCRTSSPTLRTLTTGTTGTPTSMFFTEQEMASFSALGAINFLQQDKIHPADVVQLSTSARGTLANTVFLDACQRIGALVYQTGIIEPEQALVLLAEHRNLPGKHTQPSVLLTYPSYLGRLVTTGLAQGYCPADFGLKCILLGGEIVTEAVKQRSRTLFGDVIFEEAYGITETYPFGGVICAEQHLHVEPWSGLMEVVDPDTGQAVAPGQVGTLVMTPFAPFRQSMVVLRYDTGDLVERPAAACTCRLTQLPVAGRLLGKRRLAVHDGQTWITPRHVLEALEALPCLPLPVRCGLAQAHGGVTVEVVVPDAPAGMREQIMTHLLTQGVGCQSVRLVDHPAQLHHPFPLRGDLDERGFSPSLPTLVARTHNGSHSLDAAPRRRRVEEMS